MDLSEIHIQKLLDFKQALILFLFFFFYFSTKAKIYIEKSFYWRITANTNYNLHDNRTKKQRCENNRWWYSYVDFDENEWR